MTEILEGLLFVIVGFLIIAIVLKAVKIMTGDDDAGKS